MQVNTTTLPTDWSGVPDAPGLDESRFAGDERLFVQFFRKPQLQSGLSQQEGRAIYKEVDYIRIMVPGDKLSIVERPVDSIDERRFADRYAKWKAGAGSAVEGTPLSSLPKMTPSKVEEYKFFNILTVEQLAEAADSVGQKFFSFQEDKRAAKAFIELAKGNAPIEKMNLELKERDAKIEEMQAQIEALTKMMNSKGKSKQSEE
jgi:uncharacterized coiled-coil protein SlyX